MEPTGLKTTLTRPKVPQGNKSGTESPKQGLLDYGKALPGYYSRWNCISVISFGCSCLFSGQLHLLFLCDQYPSTDNLIHNSGLILKVTDKNHDPEYRVTENNDREKQPNFMTEMRFQRE